MDHSKVGIQKGKEWVKPYLPLIFKDFLVYLCQASATFAIDNSLVRGYN